MKISFDIECTPQEARSFLGLPDLQALHDLYLDKMKTLVTDGIGPAEFEKLARAWMPGMAEGLESWRQAFWNAGRRS